MKTIKKNIKLIIGIIIGVILTCGIVYATTYNAGEVTYKNNQSVEYALNDLYSKCNNNLTVQNSKHLYYKGNLSSQTLSDNIDKGKYIVFINSTRAYGDGEGTHDIYTNEPFSNDFGSLSINISKNNSICNKLSGNYFWRSGSSKWTYAYETAVIYNDIYYIELEENSNVQISFNIDYSDDCCGFIIDAEFMKIS